MAAVTAPVSTFWPLSAHLARIPGLGVDIFWVLPFGLSPVRQEPTFFLPKVWVLQGLD